MIRSMTGFGGATADVPGGRLAVEVRSVNHRFSEVQIRLPRDLAPLDDRVRALVQRRIHRGRVEVVVTRDEGARRPRTVRADVDLAVAYARALRDLAAAVGARNEVTLAQIAALPEVLKIEDERGDPEALWPVLESALRAATDGLVAMRAAEGQRIADDLQRRVAALATMVEVIAGRSREVTRAYRERLRVRLAELLDQAPVDEARIAAELALFAERSDISEELVRLRSHLAQFQETIAGADGPVGRKLDFLLQEMSRETNTIGAKANDLEIARTIIAMKSELESLREQVQNVE
ncbi:MAG: YicC/YloC family endoribonuclease [Armatimonadota bacterium]|nr:YicC/YloC family endoribonuclease [Armatimonadota bacterium]